MLFYTPVPARKSIPNIILAAHLPKCRGSAIKSRTQPWTPNFAFLAIDFGCRIVYTGTNINIIRYLLYVAIHISDIDQWNIPLHTYTSTTNPVPPKK